MSGSKPLYDYEATRRIDTETIDSGFPEAQLMGQAALASLHALADRLRGTKRLFLLCGTGNNGGDGLALAYMLLTPESGPAVVSSTTPPSGAGSTCTRQGLPEPKTPGFTKANSGGRVCL